MGRSYATACLWAWSRGPRASAAKPAKLSNRMTSPALSFAPELLLRAQGNGLALKAAIFDVDGVLTDGRIYIGEQGETVKADPRRIGQAWLEPVVAFDCRHDVARVGEAGVVVERVNDAPEMVGVRVREDDVRDFGGIEAGTREPIWKAAE